MQIDYVSARKRSVRAQTKMHANKTRNKRAGAYICWNKPTHAHARTHAHLSANSGQIFYTFMVVQQPQQPPPPPPTDRPTVCQSSKYAVPPDDVLGASATCAKALAGCNSRVSLGSGWWW